MQEKNPCWENFFYSRYAAGPCSKLFTGGWFSIGNLFPLFESVNSTHLSKICILFAYWAQCQTSWTVGENAVISRWVSTILELKS